MEGLSPLKKGELEPFDMLRARRGKGGADG